MPSNDPHPTKNQRREEARAKAAALREQQRRTQRRNRMIGIGVLAVAVIGLLVAGILIVNNRGSSTAAGSGEVAYPETSPTLGLTDVTAPKAATASNGGIPVSTGGVGVAGAAGVTVDLYFDFMCPWCGEFDRTNAADVTALSGQAGVTVVYHPISIMDGQSKGTVYSTRAANAAAVVADQDPTHFPAFVTAMYAKGTQPEEGTSGLTDSKIASIAQGVGVSSSVTDHFTRTTTINGATVRAFAPWVSATTRLTPVNSSGYISTPTIVINGNRWSGDFTTAGAFKAAVEAAKKS